MWLSAAFMRKPFRAIITPAPPPTLEERTSQWVKMGTKHPDSIGWGEYKHVFIHHNEPITKCVLVLTKMDSPERYQLFYAWSLLDAVAIEYGIQLTATLHEIHKLNLPMLTQAFRTHQHQPDRIPRYVLVAQRWERNGNDFMNSLTTTPGQVYSMFAQLLALISIASVGLEAVHNDLYLRNVLACKRKTEWTTAILELHHKDKLLRFPLNGVHAVITDVDLMTFGHVSHMRRRDEMYRVDTNQHVTDRFTKWHESGSKAHVLFVSEILPYARDAAALLSSVNVEDRSLYPGLHDALEAVRKSINQGKGNNPTEGADICWAALEAISGHLSPEQLSSSSSLTSTSRGDNVIVEWNMHPNWNKHTLRAKRRTIIRTCMQHRQQHTSPDDTSDTHTYSV